MHPSPIISISVAESVGVYAPLTEAGTLFVDGVLASSYALLEDHRLAHWAFGPLRLFSSLSHLLWGETAKGHQTTDSQETCTPMSFSGLSTQDKANIYVNDGILSKQNNLSEPMRMEIKEKHSLQRRISHVHWYARLLYSIGCLVLDANSFHP